jgi:purine-binding chemotaxis protein CheW
MTDSAEAEFEEQQDTLKGRFMTFTIGQETYGIEIRYVTEIVGIQQSTELPESPDYIKGIINLRGKIIPVMDVRLRFSKAQKEYDDRTCIIVADFSGMSVGLIVDSVSEVVTLEKENIVEMQSGVGINNRYVNNIGKIGGNVILLLDSGKLLTGKEIEALGEAL